MHRGRPRLPLLPILLAAGGCLDPFPAGLPDGPSIAAGGTFSYVATSARSDTLLAGIVTLVAADSGKVTGTWAVHWVPGADSTPWIGLHGGAGTVTGSVRGSWADLSLLRPDTSQGFTLQAFADSSGWAGRWSYRDSVTTRRGGYFTAHLDP